VTPKCHLQEGYLERANVNSRMVHGMKEILYENAQFLHCQHVGMDMDVKFTSAVIQVLVMSWIKLTKTHN